LELHDWSGGTSYFNAHASKTGYSVPIVAGHLLNHHRILTAPTFNSANVLRVQPSLTITEAEITQVLQALDATAALIAHEAFDELFACMVSTPKTTPRVHRPMTTRSPLRTRASQPTSQRKARFAFLIHPTDDDALFNILPPSITAAGDAARDAWLKWLHSWSSKMHDPAPVFHIPHLESASGALAEGWLIACQLTPAEMIRLGAEARQQLIEKYIEEARKLDVDMVGLGAFTSVISHGGTSVADRGVNITTGNSLTAICSAATLLRYAMLRAEHWDNERFAVVGAAGSVGRLVAFHLAHHGAGRIRLIGNAANKRALNALKSVAGEIFADILQHGSADDEFGLAKALRLLSRAELAALRSQRPTDESAYARFYDEIAAQFAALGVDECPISITTDVAQGVRDSRFIVTATSAGRSFITADSFMEGAIVCDVARPLDVLNRMEGLREDLLVFEGGLMKLPMNISFGTQNMLGYPPGVNLACLSESMVLALEGIKGNRSVGNRIDYREAMEIYALAAKHGFAPYMAHEAAAAYSGATDDTGTLPKLENAEAMLVSVR
jgi:predicted amino acid dehydrogenase